MAQFKYSAISHSGERVNGMIEGFNELDAANRIKQTCDIILKIAEVNEHSALGIMNMEIGGNKLNSKAFVVMCSQFAIILKAGVPIARTCNLIAEKTTDKPLKKLLTKVASDVESGRSLSAAFEDHGKKLLPPTFVETIRAGEESGEIDRSFATMHDHFDKTAKTAQKVRSAAAYPIFVMVIAVGVVFILMTRVIPTFTEVFAEGGSDLPGSMKLLIGISDFFRDNILIMIAVIAASILGVKLYGNTESGRTNIAKLLLMPPIIGEINILSAASQFANSMATMMSSGLPIPKAIQITAKVINNYYIATETGKLTAEIETGRTLGAAMREQNVMPSILIDMTSVGEETGELAETLHTIAEFYDNELETAINNALAKLEPTLLIAIAVIAGFIVITMYTTMFTMYDNIG